MKLTGKQYATIINSLQVAARRFEANADMIRKELPSQPSYDVLATIFTTQAAEAVELANEILDRTNDGADGERRMFLVRSFESRLELRAFSFTELRLHNADDPQLVADLAALQIGRSMTIGGGAAAEFFITRLEDSEGV